MKFFYIKTTIIAHFSALISMGFMIILPSIWRCFLSIEICDLRDYFHLLTLPFMLSPIFFVISYIPITLISLIVHFYIKKYKNNLHYYLFGFLAAISIAYLMYYEKDNFYDYFIVLSLGSFIYVRCFLYKYNKFQSKQDILLP